MRDSVQRDGLEHELISRRPLHLQHEVVPCIALGIARHASRHPALIHVVVGVPFVTACDSAFVAPDEALAVLGPCKLVDIKLQGLRVRDVRGVEVDVVNEIVGIVGQGVTIVGETLRRKRTHQVIVPQNVRIGVSSANMVLR